MNLYTLIIFSLILACMPLQSCSKDGGEEIRKGDWLFGTLMTTPDKAKDQADLGLDCGSLVLRWENFEPSEGTVDAAYVERVKADIKKFQDAGMNIVLDFGIHYPPAWVTRLDLCRYVNQYGDQYIDTTNGLNTLNGVFNKEVREKMSNYVKLVFNHIDPSTFFAIRIGWGYYAELHYPQPSFNGHNNSYWGFDPIAMGQHPELLPEGVSANPVPEWKPGQASEGHTKASQFIEWYLNSLTNFQDFQIKTLRKWGYTGYINALYADWGVRPGDIEEAVASDLKGISFGEKYGNLNKGYDHGRFIAAIDDPNVIVYNTCLNACYPFPMTTSIVNEDSPNPRDWSPIHYVASCAARHPLKLKVWAENDGNDNWYGMNLSFKRMQRYNLMGIMWAFEYQLYSDDPAYAQIFEYAELISDYSY